ncbi:hypothetical protein AK812_SmicGene7479 [Symbiodinium microadriaticum]|uniref:Uncharacterized protein n=1 Tax=Symbiodinium microadriaticum TaxID=2951 RepID=A0A1Q9ENI1_SYMMI|nr:hypothetical protein AK812_SmicGene7479 [Symbiodinium microadriaticum]CAE7253224.1 unnamed protein product [Symbiodinium sp. KB8]
MPAGATAQIHETQNSVTPSTQARAALKLKDPNVFMAAVVNSDVLVILIDDMDHSKFAWPCLGVMAVPGWTGGCAKLLAPARAWCRE